MILNLRLMIKNVYRSLLPTNTFHQAGKSGVLVGTRL